MALSRYALTPVRIMPLQSERQHVFKISAFPSITKPKRRRHNYVLRLYLDSTAVDPRVIWSQCQWLRSLNRDTDLILPQPIANIHGDDVTELHLGRNSKGFCTLCSWVEGARRFRPSGPGSEVLLSVGRIMGKLHVHGRTFKPPPKFRCPCWNWDGVFGPGSPWFPKTELKLPREIERLFEEVQERAKRVMRVLGNRTEVFGLIHGDLMQGNYVVNREKVGVIDFADFGRGHFLYDMAITLLMLKPFDKSGNQRAAFIQGYREANALTHEHEALLDFFIAARAVALARSVLGAPRRDLGNMRWVNQTLLWLREMSCCQ